MRRKRAQSFDSFLAQSYDSFLCEFAALVHIRLPIQRTRTADVLRGSSVLCALSVACGRSSPLRPVSLCVLLAAPRPGLCPPFLLARVWASAPLFSCACWVACSLLLLGVLLCSALPPLPSCASSPWWSGLRPFISSCPFGFWPHIQFGTLL